MGGAVNGFSTAEVASAVVTGNSAGGPAAADSITYTVSVNTDNGPVTFAGVKPAVRQWPGDEQSLRIRRLSDHEADSHRSSTLELGCHVGTHIDAPLHFRAGEPALDELPADRFAGRACVIRSGDGETPGPLAASLLDGVDLAAMDFVLFDTGTYLTCPMEESEQRLKPCGPLGEYLHEYRHTNPYFSRSDKGFFDLGDIAAQVSQPGSRNSTSMTLALAAPYRWA